MKFSTFVLQCIPITVWSLVAPAATIYSTFGPDPYIRLEAVHDVAWVGNFGFGYGRSVASPFSFSGDAYELQSITLDMARGYEAAPNLQIGIFLDEGGRPSSNAITLLTPNPTLATTTHQLLTFSFPSLSILHPDTPYWMVLQPRVVGVDDVFNAAYYFSASRLATEVQIRGYEGGWGNWVSYPSGPPPVFRLNGIVVVPEPSTWALLGLGSAFLWCAARLRQAVPVRKHSLSWGR
jgi:hypothetical protein